jgi:hypothetical protein
MMVDAGYYDEKGDYALDVHISANHGDLYLTPRQPQAGAVLDFMKKNADKFKNQASGDDMIYNYPGHPTVSEFEPGQSNGCTAKFVNDEDLIKISGRTEIRHLVVFSRPDHLRKVKLEEVAFIRPTTAVPSYEGLHQGGGAVASRTLLEMDSVLGTL